MLDGNGADGPLPRALSHSVLGLETLVAGKIPVAAIVW